MTVTRNAMERVRKIEDAAIAAQKAVYRGVIRRIQTAFTPPLTNQELSVGLGLRSSGRGASDVARFVSAAPRLRRARPDSAVRALLDAVASGEVLLAVQAASVPGARRQLLVCDGPEASWLGLDWEVQNLGGGPVPDRRADELDWESDDVWDLMGAAAEAVRPVTSGVRPLDDLDLPPLGLGCMRLSTPGRPTEAVAREVLETAFEVGVRLFDTADTYGEDEHDLHHNHRLLREVLGTAAVTIATKVGMLRRGRRYVPCGRPEHLIAAAEASIEALGVDRLELLQLHLIDPAVPLDESLGALADLQSRGLVRRLGLCNVDQAQVVAALEHIPVVSVQNACSVFEPRDLEGGLVGWLAARGIAYIAHSPVGGHRRKGSIADDARLSATGEPGPAALGWVLGMSPNTLVIPGATSAATVRANAPTAPSEAHAGRFDGGYRWAKRTREVAWRDAEPPLGPPTVRVVMGSPASGKTRSVDPFVARGFLRLNRDERGGKLDDLLPLLDRALAEGGRHAILDNTYPTRKSRKGVLAVAARHEVPVSCVHIDISVGEALYNAALRMLTKRGRLLGPDEIVAAGKEDPNLLPPAAIYRFHQLLEAPAIAEGFARVETLPFRRDPDPSRVRRALILDYDGTLRRSTGPAPFPTHPDQVEILPGRKELLDDYAAAGWLLLGISNQSGIARGDLTAEQAAACFARTNELLGHDIDVRFCPHPSGAAKCFCRKPMPGFGVELIEAYGLDREACLYVGDLETDREFAAHVGFRFETAEAFFGG